MLISTDICDFCDHRQIDHPNKECKVFYRYVPFGVTSIYLDEIFEERLRLILFERSIEQIKELLEQDR